jgi:hypothetical protein
MEPAGPVRHGPKAERLSDGESRINVSPSKSKASAVIDRRYSGSRYDGNPLRAIFSICSQKRSSSPSVV